MKTAMIQAPASQPASFSPVRNEGLVLPVSYFSSPFLHRLTALLEEHYADERFGAGKLSRLLCLCSMQVYRKVKRDTGLSPGHYILQFRLSKALDLLQSTDLTIGEIAWRTGFGSQNYFARSFRKRYGVPPRLMRQHRA